MKFYLTTKKLRTSKNMFALHLKLCFLAVFATIVSYAAQDVPLNQIQVLHAHNSFHLAPDRAIIDLFDSRLIDLFVDESIVEQFPENFTDTFEYSYPNVTELLGTYGVRSLEFDCYYDPEGGRYSVPAATELASGLEFFVPELEEPGWKVFHVPDIDFNSTCYTLKDCLQEVKDWSSTNPGHIPVFISIEITQHRPEEYIGEEAVGLLNSLLETVEGGPSALTSSLPINLTAFETLIEEILTVFNHSDIITPSEVQGNASDLVTAVQENGWPMLSELRGRVLFIMAPPFRSALLSLYPGLENSPIFPSSYEDSLDNPHTVFVGVQVTEPVFPTNSSLWEPQVANLTEQVTSIVDQGLIVRAFSDAGTQEARANYTYRRDQILAAGVHLVATEYPGGIMSNFFDTNYTVSLGRRSAVACNPRTADPSCTRIQHVRKPILLQIDEHEEQDLDNTVIVNDTSLEEIDNGGSLSAKTQDFVVLLAISLVVQFVVFVLDL